MRNVTMGSTVLLEGSEWLDPLEQQVRGGVRKFLHELIEQEVTEALGISRQHLYDILRERKPVSAEVAVRLGAAFGDGPDVWLRMQAAYDAWHALRTVDVSKVPRLAA